ncbi:unnamed protein product [Cuscuta europaea]|uniref:Terpene synthase metal-binding domain-containing protein n=1 Tax=Cuscuta europaea TaxID=41803 RepID=A0A9P0YJ19_CUSEU|nr:unnamed protein product [Cuscuta europaea]
MRKRADVFMAFMDEMGDFNIKQEPRTILELLEASYLALDGESILFKARLFCTETLRNGIVSQNGPDKDDISHRLSELPLHWTPPWFAARREISRLEKDNSNSKYSNLFYFAKLNFNIVQAEHQKNLVDIVRWDPNRVGDLPECMRICFEALDNITNGIVLHICEHKGWDDNSALPCLRRAAEMERGDVPSSIQCYMKEEGVTEDVAREHIRNMVHDALTEINNHCLNTKQFSSSMRMLVKCVTNAARVSRFVYQSGDGYGVQDGKTRDLIISCLIEPISLH